MEQWSVRQAHNLEIVGSNPTPANFFFRRSSLKGKIGVSKIFDVGSSPASSVFKARDSLRGSG